MNNLDRILSLAILGGLTIGLAPLAGAQTIDVSLETTTEVTTTTNTTSTETEVDIDTTTNDSSLPCTELSGLRLRFCEARQQRKDLRERLQETCGDGEEENRHTCRKEVLETTDTPRVLKARNFIRAEVKEECDDLEQGSEEWRTCAKEHHEELRTEVREQHGRIMDRVRSALGKLLHRFSFNLSAEVKEELQACREKETREETRACMAEVQAKLKADAEEEVETE